MVLYSLYEGLSPSLDTLDNIRQLDRIQEQGGGSLANDNRRLSIVGVKTEKNIGKHNKN